MVRVVGLNKSVFDHIIETYDFALSYVNNDCNCIEFCEYSYVHMHENHIEIQIVDNYDNQISICFAYNDYWRIEIE